MESDGPQVQTAIIYIDARSRYRCWRGKTGGITYSECTTIALVIQHTMRTRRIILSSVECLALPNFFLHYLLTFKNRASYI